MPTEISSGSGTTQKDGVLSSPMWLFPKLLAWFGASTGALTALCTVFGYLIEHAYLQRLGVPRTAFEATSREYVVTGGKFLAGLAPMSALGSVLFVVHYGWVVLLFGLFAAAAWRWHVSSRARLIAAALLYVSWLIAMALRFEAAQAADQEGLAIFTFGTVAGLVYLSIELSLSVSPAENFNPAREAGARLPLCALLLCSVFALPILKGIHGTSREYPNVEFLSKDRDYFCQLAGVTSETANADCGGWQLIELGKDRALLRRATDSDIYVVPASAMTTFRLHQPRSSK